MEHEKSRILTNILRDLYFRNDTIYSHMLWKEKGICTQTLEWYRLQ